MVVQHLVAFLRSLGKKNREFGNDDPRVAAVALFFHIVDADGQEQGVEKQVLYDIVSREFELAGADLKALIEAGRQANQNCLDIFPFTATLKRHLGRQECITFIGLLWEIAFADGYVYELEDTLIWRIADLIGVDRKDRLELKKLVGQKQKPAEK
ncbi:TerB family tellurite resistance protein [uncultured Bartonella sp.]|uniref:tellurite resistance TerB family protein n=1 Tax=uncultured Bartonella sp. TaxID=104108 RepID=UPI00262497FC|nr:TerB family tellurite resistance protein [uncultured Bartonella sp.]